MRVAFVCSTRAQVETSLPTARALATGGDQSLWIDLEGYYHWGSGPCLREHGIDPLRPGGTPGGRGLVHLFPPTMFLHLLAHARPVFGRLLARTAPDVVVVGNDRGLLERMMIRQAKLRGLGAVLMQDGLFWSSEVKGPAWRVSPAAFIKGLGKSMLRKVMIPLGLPHLAPSFLGLGGCDRIGVMGEASRRVLGARGVNPDRIVVVGQPRYDRCQSLPRTREAVRKRLGVRQDRTLVSLFGTFSEHERAHGPRNLRQLRFVEDLAGFVRQSESWKAELLLKPHPRTPRAYARLLAQKAEAAHVAPDASSLDILVASDVVISPPSTVLAEAAVLDRPTLVFRCGCGYDVSEALGLPVGSFIEFDSFAQIEPSFREMLHRGARKAGLPASIRDEFVLLPQEGAARRAASLIHEVAEARSESADR